MYSPATAGAAATTLVANVRPARARHIEANAKDELGCFMSKPFHA
jgi:hypothetical protein